MRRAAWFYLACGAGLVAAMVMAALMSPLLNDDVPDEIRPMGAYLALLGGAGAVWFTWLIGIARFGGARSVLVWIILVGLMMRVMAWFGLPMFEDDHYRYLWDGAVTANGHNPFVYPPNSLDDTPLEPMANEAPHVLSRVNHAHLSTIYPPTAQGAFALAYWIAPFDGAGLRLLWHGFDIAVAVLMLIIALLSTMRIATT